jgi:hypothetical protein
MIGRAHHRCGDNLRWTQLLILSFTVSLISWLISSQAWGNSWSFCKVLANKAPTRVFLDAKSGDRRPLSVLAARPRTRAKLAGKAQNPSVYVSDVIPGGLISSMNST